MLLALALTLREAVVTQVKSPTGDDCLQTVICTSRITLARILVNIEGFDLEKANRVLEIFIFNQSRQKLEDMGSTTITSWRGLIIDCAFIHHIRRTNALH